jgi:hypothetical protein
MKLPRVTDRRKQYCLILAVTIIWIVAGLYAGFHEKGHTYKVDVDGDGVEETVTEYRIETGQFIRLETEENGNVICKFYGIDGTLIARWLMIPNSENPGGYTIYIWDEKSQDWLLDQDQDGIPDSAEEAAGSHFHLLQLCMDSS